MLKEQVVAIIILLLILVALFALKQIWELGGRVPSVFGFAFMLLILIFGPIFPQKSNFSLFLKPNQTIQAETGKLCIYTEYDGSNILTEEFVINGEPILHRKGEFAQIKAERIINRSLAGIVFQTDDLIKGTEVLDNVNLYIE